MTQKENSYSVRDRRCASSGDYNALTKLGFAWKFWCDATRNAMGFIIWRPWTSTSKLIKKRFEHIDSHSSFQDMLLLTKVRSKGHCSMKQKVMGSSQTWQIIFRRTWIWFFCISALFRERQQSQGKEEMTCSKGPWVTDDPANITILRKKLQKKNSQTLRNEGEIDLPSHHINQAYPIGGPEATS